MQNHPARPHRPPPLSVRGDFDSVADRPNHTHECRDCGCSIDCRQTDAECDANGGIGQYGGTCAPCGAKWEAANRRA